MKAFFLSLCLFFAALVPSYAAESESVDTGKVVASLVSSHDSAAPGETIELALRTILDPGWHTYWRNPGDSGEPVQLDWQLPEGWETGEITWPLPMTLPTGPIINYGFEGAPLFPVSAVVPETAEPGTIQTLTLDFYYLVCADICIPENGSASIDMPIGESVKDARWDVLIQDAVNTSPKPAPIAAVINQEAEEAVLTLADLPEGDFSESYFFPFDQGIVAHSEPQTVAKGENGIEIRTSSEYGWDNGLPDQISGVLSYQQNGVRTGSEINVTVGESLDIGLVASAGDAAAVRAGSFTLIGAIFGALIGGLILNLMPCVFPVISMKALSIAKTAHGERAVIRREAWAYTAGVLATFLVLTILLIALKAAGSEIGWGFQLQSPLVVAGLALLIFAVGLNLLGVFEFGTSFQNTGSSLTTKGGVRGSFFTGLLAVIVATPCTAPFMAGAIGYAVAQPVAVTVAVFLALAIGFALPFLLIAYVPRLLKVLPKPGRWMVRFKELLAFPMFAAAIWLVWVVSLQAGSMGLLKVLSAMLLLALAVWAFKSSKNSIKSLAVLVGVLALFVIISIRPGSATTVDLTHEAWSTERVDELRADGRAVFVDFTAAWCVTCKVNETLVLENDKTKQLFLDTNTAFLVADWTNKNDEIAQELERYGRAGVPLYLVFPSGDNSVSAEVLPQVLTYDVIKDAIERAKDGSTS
ncbi:protein-disulfide reductase DsbD family protein [Litorimonas sp.]|uniref:protein-disulfide reductase DsbD family protein n=1 Tax=Litorimonas sp. TaxID=1892381 RepID=UPI003A886525